MHQNLHASWRDANQRLMNAVEPESYIRPHRHSLDPKIESLIALRGRFGVLIFGGQGQITESVILGSGAAGDCSLVQIRPDQWHTVVSLEPGSILFEAKAGPFDPVTAKEFAPWAPAEGDASAVEYLDRLRVGLGAIR
jgi:cupin fold WbuC family metalloprotein